MVRRVRIAWSTDGSMLKIKASRRAQFDTCREAHAGSRIVVEYHISGAAFAFFEASIVTMFRDMLT
jgi:hypothetical protein